MKSIILFAMLLPGTAFARSGGGAGRASSTLKSGSSLYGLCAGDASNEGTKWKKSYCGDIDDALDTQKGCSVENSTAPKAGDPSTNLVDTLQNDAGFKKSLSEACPADEIQKISADKTKFDLFIKQLFAVLAIQENEWESGGVSSMGARGIMQLDKKSVAIYGKCSLACATLAKTGNFKGDNDDTMKCGVTIGLYYMVADHTMGQGSGDKGSRGLARYYQPFRRIDHKNRTWMMAKLSNYCKNRIDTDAAQPVMGGGTSNIRQ